MAINLKKGQKISLSKEAPGMDKVIVGMGWDTSSGGSSFDLDACAFLVDENGKMTENEDFVFFNNLKNGNSSVEHTGDNLTGEGEGDDEQIKVELSKVPDNVSKIIFYGTIFDGKSKNQNFGQVSNAYIRLVDENTNNEVAKFDLSEDYSTDISICLGELYRHNGEWKFNSIGNGADKEISEILETYNK